MNMQNLRRLNLQYQWMQFDRHMVVARLNTTIGLTLKHHAWKVLYEARIPQWG